MVCQFCNKKEATVHLTQIVSSEVKKMDLCENCAKEKGVNDPGGFVFKELLDGISGGTEKPSETETRDAQLRCENCGYTQADFKKNGRLGCSECYGVFATQLGTHLKTMHKGTHHKGKTPKKRARQRQEDPAELEKQLAAAIGREEFEKAAQLRDRLKLLRNPESKSDTPAGR